MKKILIFLFILLYEFSLAQVNYEPGVILLKVKNPHVVKIKNKKAVNSADLNIIFTNYRILSSKELPYLSSLTEGWYRLEFPIKSNLQIIKSELLKCNAIEKVTLNYRGSLCSIPNDTYWN